MNIINKKPVDSLGYNFIDKQWLPKGRNEYYLRNLQNRSGIKYRKLSASEIEVLVKNHNSSDNWNKVLVSEAFNPDLVKNCKFYGLVRIGKLEPYFLEFHNLRMQVGLYNSTIISCDIGDNVVVDNVNYMSHYILGSEVMIVNVNELATTSYAKFGNGILKDGEKEATRIWLEICNENAGRKIMPFNGMLPGDAWLWSRNRSDEVLQKKFIEFTERRFDKKRGYYGKIGDRTIIKNCRIIKDVWIGTDTYVKGANKIKNVTINSSAESITQIGEGCELVNGIIGFGCRIFYGVKAVRFILASNSQLKYGARLINSYLGDNSTISCCEVLNSLIFPGHEQHHNNSFLCAALVMGQSNMAAGATIGSNHNSRSPDGEIVAGRGFWPGLCVSLKHNSKFASFAIIAKGDYPYELNIPIPFALISNDTANNRLVVMPAYWFLYNLYALSRNSWKYDARDKRLDKTQHIDFDFLAPDSVNEIFDTLSLLEKFTGKAWLLNERKGEGFSEEEFIEAGKQILNSTEDSLAGLEIRAEGFENSKRDTVLIKVKEAYTAYRELVLYYGITKLIDHINENKINSWDALMSSVPAKPERKNCVNAGGQIFINEQLDKLKVNIRSGKIKSWEDVHKFYENAGKNYPVEKFKHAIASLFEIEETSKKKLTPVHFKSWLNQSVSIKEWLVKGIYDSRSKDYSNPFRKMVYEDEKEMEKVVGRFNDNQFINQQLESLAEYKSTVKKLIKRLKL